MGIFQDHYQANQLKGMSESKIAWILSIQSCLLFLSGLVVGKVGGPPMRARASSTPH
jgi:hypothetical protein